MNQNLKSILQLLTIVSWVVSILFWVDGEFHFLTDVGLTFIAAGLLSICLWANYRKDLAPDFLYKVSPRYFQRGGFTFAIVPVVREKGCHLDIFFQNRYSGDCRAQVVLKPSRGFFLTRNKLDHFLISILCEGGSFGVTSVPWGIPQEYQGKQQGLDVAATCKYPDGKGKMLRFRDGMNVEKASTEPWMQATMIVGALSVGMVYMPGKPASFKLQLPQGVTESFPDDTKIETRILWRPGDPTDLALKS